KVISPDSGLTVKTLTRGFFVGAEPGGNLRSGTGTSGPALRRSSILCHCSGVPLAFVTVNWTEPGTIGVFESTTTWSGSPVPGGRSSLATCAFWVTEVALMPTHSNLAWAADER